MDEKENELFFVAKRPCCMAMKKTQWIAGVDEAGEKACEAFARPCQIVLEALAEQNYRQGVLFL